MKQGNQEHRQKAIGASPTKLHRKKTEKKKKGGVVGEFDWLICDLIEGLVNQIADLIGSCVKRPHANILMLVITTFQAQIPRFCSLVQQWLST